MNKRILLVDFYNEFLRNWVIVPITNDYGEHFGAVFGFLRSLKTAIELFRPSDVIITFDGPKAGLKRKILYKEYKSNRNKKWKRGSIRAFDFLSEEEQNNNFGFQISRIKDYLGCLPVKCVRIPYVEADDVIAEICNKWNHECVICSSDTDFLQLLRDGVYCYSPVKKKFIGRNQFIKKYGILPENYIFVKIVNGDKSDNIPGIYGMGEKTIIKLFPQLSENILSSVDDLLENARERLAIKKLSKGTINGLNKLIENEEVLKRNFNLMQLGDSDISMNSIEVIEKIVERKVGNFKKIKIRKMLSEDKMYKHMRHFDEWIRAFSMLEKK